ncbi:MAG: hypothetical protein ABSH27_08525 [Solirubrobacteraceae bacterium]|jgi:hypothetical protein
MGIAQPRLKLRRRPALAAVVALAVVLTGCSTHEVSPITPAALASARAFSEYLDFWAGLSVDGVPLTVADTPNDFYSPVGFTMYYGNCEGRGTLRDGGCTLPLKITTTIYSPHSDASFGPQHWVEVHGVPAVVYDGGKEIEIYTDHQDVDIVADSPARAAAAAAALKPFNRVLPPGAPDFPQPLYTPNPPQVSLNGASGPTGATGATTGLAPPPQLEPAPS